MTRFSNLKLDYLYMRFKWVNVNGLIKLQVMAFGLLGTKFANGQLDPKNHT